MYGIGIGEDVVGRLPISVLAGATEACHPERRRIASARAFSVLEPRLINARERSVFGETGTDQAEPVWIR
jgi:hypothetical protein